MNHLWNMMKAAAGGIDGQLGTVRFGLVSSFDPSSYAVRVMIQPENVLSGWLPVLSAWVGNGWGLAAPMVPGTQVVVLTQEGNAEQGVVVGGVWSAVDQPPGAPAGELWLQHESGSFIKLLTDGSISVQAQTVNVSGNLVVTGDISDRNGVHGTLNAFRSAYDQHTHPNGQGGVTGLPSEIV